MLGYESSSRNFRPMRRVRTVEVIELQFRTAVDVPSDLVMCVSSGGQLPSARKWTFTNLRRTMNPTQFQVSSTDMIGDATPSLGLLLIRDLRWSSTHHAVDQKQADIALNASVKSTDTSKR